MVLVLFDIYNHTDPFSLPKLNNPTTPQAHHTPLAHLPFSAHLTKNNTTLPRFFYKIPVKPQVKHSLHPPPLIPANPSSHSHPLLWQHSTSSFHSKTTTTLQFYPSGLSYQRKLQNSIGRQNLIQRCRLPHPHPMFLIEGKRLRNPRRGL